MSTTVLPPADFTATTPTSPMGALPTATAPGSTMPAVPGVTTPTSPMGAIPTATAPGNVLGTAPTATAPATVMPASPTAVAPNSPMAGFPFGEPPAPLIPMSRIAGLKDRFDQAEILEVDGLPVSGCTLNYNGETYEMLYNGDENGRAKWVTADEVASIVYNASPEYFVLTVDAVSSISNDDTTPEFPWQTVNPWNSGEGVTTQPVFSAPAAMTTKRLIRDVSDLSATELYLFDRQFRKILTDWNLPQAIDDFRTEVLEALLAGPAGIALLEAVTQAQAANALGMITRSQSSDSAARTANTYTDAAGITPMELTANTLYKVEVFLTVSAGSTAGIQIRLNSANMPSLFRLDVLTGSGATSVANGGAGTPLVLMSQTGLINAGFGQRYAHGFIFPSVDMTMTLQWGTAATPSGGDSARILRGSGIRLTPIFQ